MIPSCYTDFDDGRCINEAVYTAHLAHSEMAYFQFCEECMATLRSVWPDDIVWIRSMHRKVE